jgi:hypothetical protein
MFLSFISSSSSSDFASLFYGSTVASTVNLSRQAHDRDRICHQFKYEVMWTEIYFLWEKDGSFAVYFCPGKGCFGRGHFITAS